MAVKCETMVDVRREIDRLDETIVPLLLERLEYVRQAGHIKTDKNTVRDNSRVEDVVMKAKKSAEKHGGDPSYIEAIYRYLIEWSIQYEFDVWEKADNNSLE